MTQELFSGKGEGVGISLRKKKQKCVKNQTLGRLWSINTINIRGSSFNMIRGDEDIEGRP